MSSPNTAGLLPPHQQTLADSARFEGIGLHTGADCSVLVCPAPTDHGVVFHVEGTTIPALAENVATTNRCSSLARGSASVATVEHLLAALSGLGIDNADLHVEGPEIPALDGSAHPFAQSFLDTGIVLQDAEPHFVRLREPIWISEQDRHILAFPSDRFTVIAAVDFGRPHAGPQAFAYSPDGPTYARDAMHHVSVAGGAVVQPWPDLLQPLSEGPTGLDFFLEELAPARTFCFEDWIPAIRAAGLGAGGSHDNTVVLSDSGPTPALRFPDELARHKTLDLLGDLSLVGGRLLASVIAIKAGHGLHLAAARQICERAHAEL